MMDQKSIGVKELRPDDVQVKERPGFTAYYFLDASGSNVHLRISKMKSNLVTLKCGSCSMSGDTSTLEMSKNSIIFALRDGPEMVMLSTVTISEETGEKLVRIQELKRYFDACGENC